MIDQDDAQQLVSRVERIQALVHAMRESLPDEGRGAMRRDLEDLYDEDGLPASS